MKLTKLVVAVAITVAASVSSAQANGPKTDITSVDTYRTSSAFALQSCVMEASVMLIELEMNELTGEKKPVGAGLSKCVQTGNANMRPLFKNAIADTPDNAKEALKEYQLALMTALDGLLPGLSERRISYEVRIQRLQGDVQKAWNKFLLEL